MSPPCADIENAASELAGAFAGVAVASVPIARQRDCRGDCLAGGLVQGEHALCARLRCASRRAQFVAGRVAARQALACLGKDFASFPVEILRDRQGAPFVVGHPTVQISISHANDIALAVAAHVPVGVDLEADDPRPVGFARLFCSAGEQRRLSTASHQDRQTLLNTLWTRKEAVSKVGRWGGTLVFAALDCLDSSVLIEDWFIEVRSACAAGYVLSVASTSGRTFAHG
jgi:phosphopantetheinyl transferase